ncbi:MAG: nucleotidyltransferase domain-containing protein [Bacteroidota bacterium]
MLPSIIEKHIEDLTRLCEIHHLKRLWVFGSVLGQNFGEDSDIDLLYEWDRGSILDEDYLNNHSQFIESVESLFGRKIDFVHFPSLKNPYFIEEIKETSVLLYDKESKKVPV